MIRASSRRSQVCSSSDSNNVAWISEPSASRVRARLWRRRLSRPARGLDLIEDVEGARAREEDGEQERKRRHRLPPSGQQRQALGRLARRGDLDLDAERVLLVGFAGGGLLLMLCGLLLCGLLLRGP